MVSPLEVGAAVPVHAVQDASGTSPASAAADTLEQQVHVYVHCKGLQASVAGSPWQSGSVVPAAERVNSEPRCWEREEAGEPLIKATGA